jgi:hypothetical protein
VLSQIWVLRFPAEPQLFGVYTSCHTVLKHSYKILCILQTKCLNILPFHFPTSIAGTLNSSGFQKAQYTGDEYFQTSTNTPSTAR